MNKKNSRQTINFFRHDKYLISEYLNACFNDKFLFSTNEADRLFFPRFSFPWGFVLTCWRGICVFCITITNFSFFFSIFFIFFAFFTLLCIIFLGLICFLWTH